MLHTHGGYKTHGQGQACQRKGLLVGKGWGGEKLLKEIENNPKQHADPELSVTDIAIT